MTVQTPSHTNAADLGARHSFLLHSILYGSNLIQEGVYWLPYRVGDERSTAFAGIAKSILEDADELDNISTVLQQFDSESEIRMFLSAADADTNARLQRSWDVASYGLRLQAETLPGKAARELDRKPKHIYCTAPTENVGQCYADLTYWAVGAVRDLNVSAQHPSRHKHHSETTLTREVRNTKALLLAVANTGHLLETVNGWSAGAVLAQFDAQTRVRARLFARDIPRRLRPLL